MTTKAGSPGILAVAVLLMLLPPAAVAQQLDGTRVAAVQTLRPGQVLRLDLAHTARVEGLLTLRNDTSLTLAGQDGPIRISLPEIERLWVRGRATRTGALIGAGVGLAAGLLYGFAISEAACGESDCSRAAVAGFVGLLGGAAGTVLGGGVGFALPRWQLRFP
jgi:hypothetical protein